MENDSKLYIKKIVLLLCLIVTVGRFALDSYLPSLPAIATYFNANISYTQYTLTLYLIGFGASQLFYGPLSERYGRRKVILFGFGIFIIGNILCSIANSINTLILSRFLAGIGGGVGPALKRAIATDNFKGKELAKVWSNLSIALVITLIIAPVIGGYAQEFLGWRANFILIILYVSSIFLFLLRYLPETNKNINSSPLVFNLIINNYYTLLTYKPFIGCVTCSTLAFAGLMSYFQLSPFLIIDRLGFSSSSYGLLSFGIAGAYLIAGVLLNPLIDKLGAQNMLIVGMFIILFGGILMSVPAMIFVIGARIVIPNAAAEALTPSGNLSGYASAIMGGVQIIGSSIVSFLISGLSNKNQLSLSLVFISLGLLSITIFFSTIYTRNR